MLPYLVHYAAFDELPEILRYFDSGNTEGAIETCLRAIIAAPDASESNRLFAKQTLAEWSIQEHDKREYVQRRTKELEAGDAPQSPREVPYLKTLEQGMLAADKLDALEKEAIKIFTQLSQLKSDIRQPAVKAIDPEYHLIKVDAEATKTRPLISDMASGLLFKTQYLRIGKMAPELKLTRVNDDAAWTLADQKGKAVIIQFSFKGCGPCEAMYPDLVELTEKYKDKLSFVSIMADETREVSLESHRSGKMPWNVHFDGVRGPLATKWAVRGYPTVYVVAPDGKIAAEELRGEQLKSKIAELCK
jgi:thiol-disulfide isomerase/thioredoxin